MGPEDILKQYESKINHHRFDDVEPLLSDKSVFWFTDGSYFGKAAIRKVFEQTWQTLDNDTYLQSSLSLVCIAGFPPARPGDRQTAKQLSATFRSIDPRTPDKALERKAGLSCKREQELLKSTYKVQRHSVCRKDES